MVDFTYLCLKFLGKMSTSLRVIAFWPLLNSNSGCVRSGVKCYQIVWINAPVVFYAPLWNRLHVGCSASFSAIVAHIQFPYTPFCTSNRRFSLEIGILHFCWPISSDLGHGTFKIDTTHFGDIWHCLLFIVYYLQNNHRLQAHLRLQSRTHRHTHSHTLTHK